MKICQYSELPDQLFMWSEAALAVDMAELSFLAAITAAPRFWTVGTKTVFTLSLSRLAGAPGWEQGASEREEQEQEQQQEQE